MVKAKGTLANSVKKQSLVKKELEGLLEDQGPNVPLRRLNCDLPVDLFKKLKIRATNEETSIKEIIIKSVKEYLKK